VHPIDFKTVIVSDGSEDSITISLESTEYFVLSIISETDPNTGLMWDVAALNAAYIGFEVG
jgi:predicted secreted protein